MRPVTDMRTVFLTVSDGEVAKSIFQSDVFLHLKDHVRLVCFVHKNKFDYFSSRYADNTVDICTNPPADRPWLEEYFSDIFLYSLHTRSIAVKIEHSYFSGGTLLGRLVKYALWSLGAFLTYRRFFRSVYFLIPDRSYDEFFKKYKPDLVFAANLTSMDDARLLKAAHRFGVRSIGMPKGWDNLTLKTFLPVFPDKLLVQTELMKKDAVALDFPEERIRVTGFPKFDVYKTAPSTDGRRAFMQKLGLNPDRKLILYAGAGDQLARYDEEILARLLVAIEEGKIQGEPQVLVRPHPKYIYRSEKIPARAFWVLDRPGRVVGKSMADFEFERDDVEHLKASLAYADVLIHTASTLGVEASIFDKPAITIAFDGDAHPPPALSVARYYQYEHLDRVIATGGMPQAHSFEELVALTNDYLNNPSRDAGGRTRIVEENSFGIGSAGRRVASEVLEFLGA